MILNERYNFVRYQSQGGDIKPPVVNTETTDKDVKKGKKATITVTVVNPIKLVKDDTAQSGLGESGEGVPWNRNRIMPTGGAKDD